MSAYLINKIIPASHTATIKKDKPPRHRHKQEFFFISFMASREY